jgi:hypothetical protein
MFQTVYGVLQPNGTIQLLEAVQIPQPVRVLVAFVEDIPNDAILSEASLAQDWRNDEEEKTWLHLQAAQ